MISFEVPIVTMVTVTEIAAVAKLPVTKLSLHQSAIVTSSDRHFRRHLFVSINFRLTVRPTSLQLSPPLRH